MTIQSPFENHALYQPQRILNHQTIKVGDGAKAYCTKNSIWKTFSSSTSSKKIDLQQNFEHFESTPSKIEPKTFRIGLHYTICIGA